MHRPLSRHIALLLWILVAGVGPTVTSAEQQRAEAQVLFGADFETEGKSGQPDGWFFRQSRGDCSGRWDYEQAVSGRHSLRMSIAEDMTARAHWVHRTHIAIKPSTWYRLSTKVMTVDVAGEAYVICYENGEADPEHFHYTPHARGTEDWRECAIVFHSREDADWVSVVCKLRHGTGTAWFDDVTLEERPVGPEPEGDVRVPPENDGFVLQAMWTPAQWCRGDVMHLVRGHLNPLGVFFWGDKESVKAPAIVIEASEGIAMRGPVVMGRGPMAEDVHPEPRMVQRDGKTFRAWRFPIPEQPLLRRLRDKPRWDMYHHIYADVSAGCPAEGELRWRLESDGKLGPGHRLRIAVPPDIPEKLVPPDDFRIYVQHTGALRHPDPAVRERLIAYLNSAGIAGGLGMTFYEPDKVPVDEHYRELGFDLHTWRFDSYHGSVSEDHRLVDSDSETSKTRVCPQSQIERVQPWCNALRSYYRAKLAAGIKRLIIDYEPPVFDVCFCERCRTSFARRFDLPVDECLSLPPRELQGKYAKQWELFRAEQNGTIVKLHCNLIHEIDPEVAVGLCSWRGTEGMAERGGDITLFEPEVAFHAPMIYTHGTAYHKAVQETCQRTSRPVLPFIEIHDVLISRRSLTPEQLRMNLLATGLSGGGGAFMWVGMECFDAGYMAAIARSVREIEKLRQTVPSRCSLREQYAGSRSEPRREPGLHVEQVAESTRIVRVGGKEVKMISPNSVPFIRWHAWGTDERMLVAFLNYNDERSYKMRLIFRQPHGAGYTILDPQSGDRRGCTAEEIARGIEVEVPAGGLASVAVIAAQ